ncbi:tryptophan--tRNA ligase [Egibacter rhizosphaerae]|uniref:Tryptophan--tRNA ligase n=1 Tax=Egibacter rhizosphaerae TaxID=1670831 RepID=A0A411YLI0_9ACTN|nr:tryptophan--tRNA ligase [Egibacter rhizosphaerae]
MFSGVKPSGNPHVGNFFGAFTRWAELQQPGHFYCVVDLHAMTVPHDPAELREQTVDLASWLLASGLDPDTVTLFVQSQVREHSELAWILDCVATMGELQRMVQFKEKAAGQRDSVSVGLFNYPVLQAADIILYQADEVPVGEDQRQHIELSRDIAHRFNHRFGDTFRLPTATLPTSGARVMDLQHPDQKMSKSEESPQGTIDLADDADTTRKKLMRAVTDSGSEIRASADKPGIGNLLELLSAATGRTIPELEDEFAGKGYGDFKKAVAEAVIERLAPVRARYAELRADPAAVHAELGKGADRAREIAAATMADVREKVGLFGAERVRGAADPAEASPA